MNEEKEEEKNGTFGEVVVGMVLLGVLCFICVEMFVADTFGVMVEDWLYAVCITVVAVAIVVGLRWRKREEVKDD